MVDVYAERLLDSGTNTGGEVVTTGATATSCTRNIHTAVHFTQSFIITGHDSLGRSINNIILIHVCL